MPFLNLDNDTKIHYITSGTGEKPILFVHGNLGNTIWWEQTLEKLPKEFTGFAPDLPGNWKTPETGQKHTMEYLSCIVEGFRKVIGLEKFYLVGHSMGGGIAQVYTMNHPERVIKLVLLNSMAADGFHTIFNGGLDRVKRMIKDKDFLSQAIRVIAPMCKDEEMLKRVIDSASKASEQVFLEQPVTMHESNWMDRVSQINCPVLFLHGDMDHFVPQDGSERTASAIGENCVFKYLKNCGHSPMLEVFDVYFKEVFDFLKN